MSIPARRRIAISRAVVVTGVLCVAVLAGAAVSGRITPGHVLLASGSPIAAVVGGLGYLRRHLVTGLLERWHGRHAAPARDHYFTPAEHRQEAERLAWVVDDVLQSNVKRSLSDLIALARLHADLGRPEEGSR